MNPNLQLKQKIAKLDHEITHNFETAYQKYWQELQNKTLNFLAQQQVNDRTTSSWGWGKDIINKNGSANKNALTSAPTNALTSSPTGVFASVPTGVFASVPKNSTGALEINSKDPEILFWQIRWKLENALKTP